VLEAADADEAMALLRSHLTCRRSSRMLTSPASTMAMNSPGSCGSAGLRLQW
jgi:hypothetical protein